MPQSHDQAHMDNAILISPKLAKSLQAENPDLGLIPEPTMLNKQGRLLPTMRILPTEDKNADRYHRIQGPKHRGSSLCPTGLSRLHRGRHPWHGTKTGRVGEGTGYDATSALVESGSQVLSGVKIEKPEVKWTFKNLANDRALSMEGRAIVREANVLTTLKRRLCPTHGSRVSFPPIWGKDQNKDLTYKSQTTPRETPPTNIPTTPTRNPIHPAATSGAWQSTLTSVRVAVPAL